MKTTITYHDGETTEFPDALPAIFPRTKQIEMVGVNGDLKHQDLNWDGITKIVIELEAE